MNRTFKKGDKVIFNDAELHRNNPEYFPAVGTVGIITMVDEETAEVSWHKGSTSKHDIWWAAFECLEHAPPSPLEIALNRLRGLIRKHKYGGPIMYINPFAAGVLVTLFAEAVLIIVSAIIKSHKN